MSSIDKIEYAGEPPKSETVAHTPPPLSVTLGNPAPVGMFAFAATTLLMTLYNLGAGGVTVPNVLVGMLVFGGGMTLFAVSMWELARGNTLSATSFLAFCTFWTSYAAILIPDFGVMAAYGDHPEQISKAIGLYLFVWFITISMLIPPVVGKSHLFTILLSTASTAILMLSCGTYTGVAALNTTGNSLLIVVSALAYYIGLAGLLLSDPNPTFSLPLF